MLFHRLRRRDFLILSALSAGGLGLLSNLGCNSKVNIGSPAPEIAAPLSRVKVDPPKIRFTDITEKAGIRFKHVTGAFSKKLLPETMGSGVAFLDYDNDGHPDILFVNSCYWPKCEAPGEPPPTLALYRNKGDGTFEDVTQKAGLAITMYGMGVTVGDYDNDGYPDIFVTGIGGNRLFRNVSDGRGGRRFQDVTTEAGVGGPGGWPDWPDDNFDFLKLDKPLNFSTSAAWLDYDGDGRLDLFVCNYVAWAPKKDIDEPYTLKGGDRAYGPPTAFEGTNCFLYRNLGNGKFEDVSAKAGIQVVGALGKPAGKSLGVIVCDVDDDGWPDIVVANDTVRNYFFHNKGDGTFEEIGVKSNLAFAVGEARGAMGIDWGEYLPGMSALLIGNFADEPDTFLRLDVPKMLLFSDAAMAVGIAGPSRQLLKFGVFFFDYDLDGRQDLLTCNGHLEPDIHEVKSGQYYRQPAQLFWNAGKESKICYAPVGEEDAGPDLFTPLVGRGCAYADIDGDGYLDVVLTENGGQARLLHNDGPDPNKGGQRNNWIRLTLEGDGVRSNKSAIGARVILKAGGVEQRREVISARGYLSQSELTLTFGLGQDQKVDQVTIQWPGKNGNKQIVNGNDLAINKTHTIRQQAQP
jgi:enediyne biosynthesis protein E4